MHMSIFNSIILGLLQGITEFLPISSSAHLVILPLFLGWKGHPLVFDVILHAATFFAIAVYFRKEWIKIIREGIGSLKSGHTPQSDDPKALWKIMVASIPILLVGFLYGEAIEYSYRDPFTIALALGLFGLFLYLAELRGKKDRSMVDITWKAAFFIKRGQ